MALEYNGVPDADDPLYTLSFTLSDAKAPAGSFSVTIQFKPAYAANWFSEIDVALPAATLSMELMAIDWTRSDGWTWYGMDENLAKAATSDVAPEVAVM